MNHFCERSVTKRSLIQKSYGAAGERIRPNLCKMRMKSRKFSSKTSNLDPLSVGIRLNQTQPRKPVIGEEIARGQRSRSDVVFVVGLLVGDKMRELLGLLGLMLSKRGTVDKIGTLFEIDETV